MKLSLKPLLTTLTTTSILGLSLCLFLLTGLGWLCYEVWEKEVFNLDIRLLMAIHQWSNPILDQIMLTITRLGDPEFVVVIVIISLGWLLWQRKRHGAIMLMIACLGAFILNLGMKFIFARPRPALWQPLIEETSYGFPSGHALGSLVLYGFLAYLFVQRYPLRSGLTYLITITLITLIGLSRLYLGVHYLSDILAGFATGLLWLILCIFLYQLSSNKILSSR